MGSYARFRCSCWRIRNNWSNYSRVVLSLNWLKYKVVLLRILTVLSKLLILTKFYCFSKWTQKFNCESLRLFMLFSEITTTTYMHLLTAFNLWSFWKFFRRLIIYYYCNFSAILIITGFFINNVTRLFNYRLLLLNFISNTISQSLNYI